MTTIVMWNWTKSKPEEKEVMISNEDLDTLIKHSEYSDLHKTYSITNTSFYIKEV